MFMNEGEIEFAAGQHHACPNVRKGVRLLLRLMRSVNEQSDGWAYWSAPSHSCEKLQALLATAGNLYHGASGTITDAQLRQAVAPIRSMATRQAKQQAKFGNTFAFDVDAALEEAREPQGV